ncbi:MAG: S41 family peptidase, partial [Bacteroidota bacterium]
TVSAKIRTRGVSARGAQVYVYGKVKGEMVGYRQSDYMTGDNDWTTVSFDLILDRAMDTLRLGCFLEGTGQAWFDDLTFTPYVAQTTTTSPVAATYLEAFFDTVSRYALYREKIDWEALRADAQSLTMGAQVEADVHPTLHYLAKRINKHTFFSEPKLAAELSGSNLADDEIRPNLEYTKGRKLEETVAYLSMPSMGGGNQVTLESFADSLQGLIMALDGEEVTGWVLDLRGNGGGNCWPMLAGVGPLLGEGVCGYFQAPDGSNAKPWTYADGKSALSGNDIVSTRGYQLKNPNARIAVLTGPMTASSGEVTTAAFIGLPRARSFGQPTAGYATTNNNYELSDGAVIYLTISVYADRNNQPVGETIMPDEVVEPVEGKDVALKAAVAWLNGE